MGCLAKVAQKPETVPEHQVIWAFVSSCFRRGGGAAIAPSTALQAFWRGVVRRRESVESFAANSSRRAPRDALACELPQLVAAISCACGRSACGPESHGSVCALNGRVGLVTARGRNTPHQKPSPEGLRPSYPHETTLPAGVTRVAERLRGSPRTRPRQPRGAFRKGGANYGLTAYQRPLAGSAC